ncbi:MAG: HAMP domain-containing histidine kinase [Agathobacter sp.]|nr:HAMP domain-containing histidine kinase [Agathobacter sp.]
MKMKNKLIISFFIVIFIPIILSIVALSVFQKLQTRTIEQAYGIRDAEGYSLTSSVQLLNRMTEEEYDQLLSDSVERPKALEDAHYLSTINEGLQDANSYLIVKKKNEVLFNGGQDNADLIETLPECKGVSENDRASNYVDGDREALVKQIDFFFDNQTPGTIYIVTGIEEMVPELRHFFLKIVISIIVILVFTAFLMIGWIYSSLVTPLKKLQVAAENIKNGNLDFTVDVSGDDEIGQLGVAFEEMRLRLKDNAEEKISDEKENRALISNIAHDLKTPITAVKGYAEGIIDGVANTPEKVDKYVRTIYNKANEMDTLINELTLYSKIDANRIPYNFAKINVSEYFQDCVEEIGLDLEAKGIGLAYYNYVDPDVMIIADPEQLRRVINNIISNSVKYMDKKNGFINIRIKDVGDFIQVELEDNGRGIAQRDLPYIFDRFFRADASRNSATGGSGIGLSIVKKIIDDHGGKIWATSKEDNGTTMYFVIRKYEEVYNNEQNIDC